MSAPSDARPAPTPPVPPARPPSPRRQRCTDSSAPRDPNPPPEHVEAAHRRVRGRDPPLEVRLRALCRSVILDGSRELLHRGVQILGQKSFAIQSLTFVLSSSTRRYTVGGCSKEELDPGARLRAAHRQNSVFRSMPPSIFLKQILHPTRPLNRYVCGVCTRIRSRDVWSRRPAPRRARISSWHPREVLDRHNRGVRGLPRAAASQGPTDLLPDRTIGDHPRRSEREAVRRTAAWQ